MEECIGHIQADSCRSVSNIGYPCAVVCRFRVNPVRPILFLHSNWPYQKERPVPLLSAANTTLNYAFDFSAPLAYAPDLLAGAWTTLTLSLASTFFGFLLGVLCAIANTKGTRWMARCAGAYIEVIRNTPLLVQVFIVYFGLSSLGWQVGAFTAATVALVVNVGAYTSEIVRAGIESIPKGQLEAAECIGLSRWQTLLHVVLPPAIERVYPALTSQYVLLMLASSICSQISAEELTAVANRIQSDTYRSVETYLIVAVAYLLMSLLMRGLFWLLARLAFPRRPPGHPTLNCHGTCYGARHGLSQCGASALSVRWFGVDRGPVFAGLRRWRSARVCGGTGKLLWPTLVAPAGVALHQADPGHASPGAVASGLLRLARIGPGRGAPGGSGDGAVDLCVGLPGRDLAWLHRIGATHPG